MTIAFTLNGRPQSVAVAGGTRVSQMLRDHLGLRATKSGCDAGDCGACTVLLDGAPVCSCLTAAGQLAGRTLTTLEGLNQTPMMARLQQAFLHHGAAQCGICTPGMLVSAMALLEHNARPTRRQVEDGLGGVLCRCTGYAPIVDAVLDAARTGDIAGDEPAGDGAPGGVGAAIARLDGMAKTAGSDVFGADAIPPDALMLKIIRSPCHRASFDIGDTDAFVRDHSGLAGVFTARDVPGKNCFGVIAPFADQPVFAVGETRFKGEAVAAVAGSHQAIADLDVADFPVTWHELPACLEPSQAQGDDAVLLHETRKGNILARGLVEKGALADGFATATHTVSGTFSTPFIEHAYIEPEAGYARRVGDRIELFASTQAPHMDRDEIASTMGLEVAQVRIVPTACGGGFGSKLDVSIQPFVAIAAWHLNQPVGLVYTRSESMASTTKRHPSHITLKIGCDDTGRLTAFDFDGTFNTGAYASWGPTVANRVPVHASGPYAIPAYRAVGTGVHTNCMPSGAFRGFGVPQSAIAQECLFDELAEKAGLDPLEFRLRNALTNGAPTVTGQVFDKGVGITACLEAIRQPWRKARRAAAQANEGNADTIRHGVGIGTCWYGCGNTALPNPSTILTGLTGDGRIVLHQGAVDIGQGSNTVIAQIAAEALGIPAGAIELVSADTDLTPDAGKTSASRQTFITGNAARKSAGVLRHAILRLANVTADARIELAGGKIVLHDGGKAHVPDLTALQSDANGYVLSACETYDPPTKPLDDKGQGDPYAQFGYGVQMVELAVDMALGKVTLNTLTAAHDVGRAINPVLVRGQVTGGVAQGIGLALMEDYQPGRSENLHDYLIPTCGDMPDITTIIVEVEDACGPYGAKGLGEHVLIPTAPAILNAIRDAVGAPVRHLPATPEAVLDAIRAGKAKQ